MYKGLIDNYRWQGFIKTCAKRADLQVVFETGTSQPRTNKDVLYLPHPDQMTSDFDRVKMLHFVNHETSHHEYSTDFDLLEEDITLAPGKTFCGDIWNGVEDNRVDMQACDEWLGVRENNDEFYEGFLPELIQTHINFQANPEFPQDFKDKRSSLIGIMLYNRSHDTYCLRQGHKEFRDILSNKANEYIDKYISLNYVPRILTAKTGVEGSREMAELAKDILRNVYGEEPEDDAFNPTQRIAATGGEGEGGGDEEGQEEALIAKFKKLFPEADLQKGTHGGGSGAGGGTYSQNSNEVSSQKSGSSGGLFVPVSIDEIRIRDIENKKAYNCSFEEPSQGYEEYYLAELDKFIKEAEDGTTGGKQLANAMRKLLQVRSRKLWSYNKKKGKLNNKALHRLVVNSHGGYNERIFKQAGQGVVLDTALQLLIDCSGSMSGAKLAYAIICADYMCDAVSRSLRVPVEIIGFSSMDTTDIQIYKTFDRPVSSDILRERMRESVNLLHHNADGEAISWAYGRLAQRPEKRKVMLVLSDGTPAIDYDYRSGNVFDYTRKIVKEIEERKIIDIIGLGFLNDAVKTIYKHSYVIKSVNLLEKGILDIVEQQLLSGVKR